MTVCAFVALLLRSCERFRSRVDVSGVWIDGKDVSSLRSIEFGANVMKNSKTFVLEGIKRGGLCM